MLFAQSRAAKRRDDSHKSCNASRDARYTLDRLIMQREDEESGKIKVESGSHPGVVLLFPYNATAVMQAILR